MDVLTPEQRRRNMQAIKSKNTKIEVLLGKAMWKLGMRYRKNDKTVFGKPDFVMKGLKIAIFCDSEFFHGKNWEAQKKRLNTNKDFWIKKIEGNIGRDKKVNEYLEKEGWTVIRFWGNDIKKDIENCLLIVKNHISKKIKMNQRLDFLDDLGDEGEDDLIQKIETFDQAVIWGTDWTTETITSQMKKDNIDVKPKFQRREAWSSNAKSQFIESLILGLPIPPIILAEKKDQKGKYIVIDGKQRLLSIRRFFVEDDTDEFDALKLSGLKLLKELNGKTYTKLKNKPEYSKVIDQIQNQTIRTIVVRSWPDEAFLYTVFFRLNTGSVRLSPQELRQALHPGEFIDFADNFSAASESIKKVLGLEKPDIRMRDVELVIRYFTFKYFIQEYTGNLKNAFDDTVKKLNTLWAERKDDIIQEAYRLNKAIDFVIETFGEKEAFSKWKNKSFNGIFNRAIFDIMVFYFSNDEILNNALTKKDEIVDAFKKLSDNNPSFVSSFEHTAKSMQNIDERFNTWGKELIRILKMPIEVPVLKDNRFSLTVVKNEDI